jgi:DMSO/TMAO reductase YedYZ molybdopterin-dependent catalytic subunit
LKKTSFAGIATTITIALVVISFAYNLISTANSENSTDTEINPAVAEWQLTVTGLVENPLKLSWTEIVAMPKSTVNAALICVDFPNNMVAQGNWTGIKLQTLLEEAKPSADAIKVAFYAADGYSTDLPVETAIRDDVILAYEKDGSPLNDLRLVVPGKWGYKWISQLTRLELVDYNFLGFWESRGYSDEAAVSAGSSSTDKFTSSMPNVSAPSPSPTTPPATSPSPSPSQPPITSPAPLQPTPTAMSSEGFSFPTEAAYAIAGLIVAVLVTAALVLKKRIK